MEKGTNKIFKIAIVGPESTGKSWLAESLAKHYQTILVPEFARTYIGNLNRKYTIDDIEVIAKNQLKNETQLYRLSNKFLFCDTTLLVTKIWSEFVFNQSILWIENNYNPLNYHHHLLCDIDLPWQPDLQREHPNKRKELFELYHQSLINDKVPFTIINGVEQERLLNAINVIEKL